MAPSPAQPPTSRSPLPLLWLGAVIGLLLVGGFFLWTQDTRRGMQQPPYSVYRTDDTGAGVVFRLYARAGLKPEAWDAPFTQLRRPGVMIMIEPAAPRQVRFAGQRIETGKEGEIFPDEIRALDDWVRQGNVAVVLARHYNELYRGLGLIVDEPQGISGEAAVPAQPSLLAQRVEELKTETQFGFKYGDRRPSRTAGVPGAAPGPVQDEEEEAPRAPLPIQAVPAEQWLPLFVKKDAMRSVPQVVSAARGRGLYVAVNDHFPSTNVGVTVDDNARFMLNLARLRPRGGTVWFDEYHKRIPDRNFMTYVRERSLLPVVIYSLLLAALFFWRTGTRFGDARPLIADERRDSAEYVRAAAMLYKNAGMTREALTTIFADFRRRLTGALRMDGLTDLEEVSRRYEMRTGRAGLEARQTLVQTEALLARAKLDEPEALQAVARLTELDQALNRPLRGRRKRNTG